MHWDNPAPGSTAELVWDRDGDRGNDVADAPVLAKTAPPPAVRTSAVSPMVAVVRFMVVSWLTHPGLSRATQS